MKLDSGYIAFTSLLVISAIILSIVVTISLLGVDELKSTLSYKKGKETLELADACLDEYLIRISRDITPPNSLILEGGQCTIDTTGTGPEYTLRITAVGNSLEYSRHLSITIRRRGTGVRVTNYQEVP